jgi:hypothetical protein
VASKSQVKRLEILSNSAVALAKMLTQAIREGRYDDAKEIRQAIDSLGRATYTARAVGGATGSSPGPAGRKPWTRRPPEEELPPELLDDEPESQPAPAETGQRTALTGALDQMAPPVASDPSTERMGPN